MSKQLERPLQPTTINARAKPVLGTAEQEAFYAEAIKSITKAKIPFLVAGTFAVSAYTGISRETKDFDIFCKAGAGRASCRCSRSSATKSGSRMSVGWAR